MTEIEQDKPLPDANNLAEFYMPSPLSGWIGGKSRLAKKLIPLFPAHKGYCEPFCGAAWLLFRKNPKISVLEIINDINGDVINLFHIIRDKPQELQKYLKWALHSRQEFSELKALNPDGLDEVQRAWRFLYMLRCGYGGRVKALTFGYQINGPSCYPRFEFLQTCLEDIHERLRHVTLECLPWADFFRRYDRPETFFYVDPPYIGVEDYYGKGLFSRLDFLELARTLRNLKGKFLLSINNHEYAREVFSGFEMREVQTQYSVSIMKTRDVKELLFSNYPLPEVV